MERQGSSTQEVNSGREAAKRELYEKLAQVERDRRAALREVMAAAAEAEDGVLSPAEKLGLSLTGSTEELVKLDTLQRRILRAEGQLILAIGPNSVGGIAGRIDAPPRANLDWDSKRGSLNLVVSNAYTWRGTTAWEPLHGRRNDSGWITLAEIEGEDRGMPEGMYSDIKPVIYKAKYPYEEQGTVLLVGYREIFSSQAAQQHAEVLSELMKNLE